MGFEVEYQREDFNLDRDEPLRAIRNERDFDALVGRTSIDSSSFDNIAVRAIAKKRSSSRCQTRWPSWGSLQAELQSLRSSPTRHGTAYRLRDQVSIPRRGVTAEDGQEASPGHRVGHFVYMTTG